MNFREISVRNLRMEIYFIFWNFLEGSLGILRIFLIFWSFYGIFCRIFLDPCWIFYRNLLRSFGILYFWETFWFFQGIFIGFYGNFLVFLMEFFRFLNFCDFEIFCGFLGNFLMEFFPQN